MQLASVKLIKNIYLATFRNRSFISQLHESVIIQMFTVCATYTGQNNSTPADLYNLISHTVIYFVPLASPSYMFPGQKPTLDVVLSPLLLHKSGTIYLLLSESHLKASNVTSKLTTLPRHNTLTT